MEFGTRRRVAGAAAVLAVAGGTTGAVMARADTAAPVARAAADNGGVSLQPDAIEHRYKKGRIGFVKIKNTTDGTLKMRVTVRPWKQNRNTGAVEPNYHANLNHYVKAFHRRFRLKAGKTRRMSIRVRRHPHHGSLYAALEVFGKQKHKKARNGIIPQYRIVGRIRVNPRHRRPKLRIGGARLVGKGKNRRLVLLVRNTGNTLDPVSGSASFTGPMKKTVNLTPATIVPGQVVYVKTVNVSSMRRGFYHIRFNLTQGGHHYTAKRVMRLR